MPDEPVCIVDNASPDRSYQADFPDLPILNVAESHYEAGAWWTAFAVFPDEPYYFFLHDSMVVQESLESYKTKPLWVPGYLADFGGCSAYHQQLIKEFIARTTYTFPERFYGAAGNVFFCQNDLMRRMKDRGMDQLLPKDKREAEAMERVWGIAFQQEGFDVKDCSWGLGDKLTDPGNLPIRKYPGRRE